MFLGCPENNTVPRHLPVHLLAKGKSAAPRPPGAVVWKSWEEVRALSKGRDKWRKSIWYSVQGTILFVSYINDIADCVSPNIKLYAGDTKIYRELRNLTSDIQMLQSDLDSIGHWANTWQLRFNA